MPDLLLKNGRIVDPASSRDETADLFIHDGKIAAIGRDLVGDGAEEFDATGLIVAPGFIDMHVHLREPGFEHAEDIETGARAAAAGGFTTICCMPNTLPVNDSPHVTQYIIDRARQCAAVRVRPIGAITRNSAGEELSPIGVLKQAGVVAISDDGKPVMSARVMRRAMEAAKAFNLPIINHCEDLHLSAGGDMHEGRESVRLGLRGIPAASEDVMVARDLLLAELTGARYHVAHLSTQRAVAMVGFAKQRGLRVSCESTPHHFALADVDMPPYDSNYKMKPPLRGRDDIDAVVEGIAYGTIDVLATDHAPHAGSEKMQEFESCPFGILGLETAIGLTLERLYHTGKIGLQRLIELYTTGPARVLSLSQGSLEVGRDADVTVLDTETLWQYDVNRSASKSRNSPFHAHEFRGGPVATIVGGSIVWRRDKE